jgi:hypothetical protein
MPRQTWDKELILKALRQRHRAGGNLAYSAMSKSDQSLVSAAAYHFDSYKAAVEAAGINYARVARRPRWTKQAIIAMIKAARRKGEDLHWSAVTRRRDELGLAAFASLQPRLFGRWDRALQGAGLDADEISQYRKWTADAVVSELRSRARDNEALNSGAIQVEDPGLHAAAIRHFGGYDAALRAARLDPARFRQRRRWDKPTVIAELASLGAGNGQPSAADLRKTHSALYGAATRLFGTFAAARAAAGRKRAGK